MVVDRSQYKVCVVLSVEACKGKSGGKPLKACKVDVVGNGSVEDESMITVVTSAPNVREGSR